MEWFYYGCEFVNSAVKMWFTLQIFAWLFEPKWELREERRIQAAAIVLLAALNTYNNSLGSGLFSNTMLVILDCVIGLLGTVLYVASFWYTASISLTIWLTMALLDFFLLSLLYVFLSSMGMQPDIFVDASVYRGVYLLLFAAVLGWISGKSQGWIRRNAAEWKKAWKRQQGWLCVFLVLLVVCMVYFQRIYKSLVTEHFWLRWVLFILAVVFSGMTFKLYRIRQKEKERNRLLQLQLELLEKNYQELWLMQ